MMHMICRSRPSLLRASLAQWMVLPVSFTQFTPVVAIATLLRRLLMRYRWIASLAPLIYYRSAFT
jgi:hypothetical protein